MKVQKSASIDNVAAQRLIGSGKLGKEEESTAAGIVKQTSLQRQAQLSTLLEESAMLNLENLKSRGCCVHLQARMARYIVVVFYKGAMKIYSLFQNSLQSLQNLSTS